MSFHELPGAPTPVSFHELPGAPWSSHGLLGSGDPRLFLAPHASSSLLWVLLAPPGFSWLLLAPPSCPWLLLPPPGLPLATQGSSWLVLAPLGSSWLLLACPGSSWLLLAVPGFSWLLLAPSGSSCLLEEPGGARMEEPGGAKGLAPAGSLPADGSRLLLAHPGSFCLLMCNFVNIADVDLWPSCCRFQPDAALGADFRMRSARRESQEPGVASTSQGERSLVEKNICSYYSKNVLT